MTLLKENLEIVLVLLGVLLLLIIFIQLKLFAAFRRVANDTSGPNPGDDYQVKPSQTERREIKSLGGENVNKENYNGNEAKVPSGEDQTTSVSSTSSQATSTPPSDAPMVTPPSSGGMEQGETGSETPVPNEKAPEPQDGLQTISVAQKYHSGSQAEVSVDKPLVPDASEPPEETGDQGENGAERGRLGNPGPKPSGDVEAKESEQTDHSQREQPALPGEPPEPGPKDGKEALIQFPKEVETLVDVKNEFATPGAVIEPEAVDVDNQRFLTLNDRYARCAEALAKFDKDFRQDENRFKIACEQYQYWKAYLLEVVATYENELVYEFTETLEDDRFHITELKKMMILPLTQNENENEKQLKVRAKDLSEEVEYLDIPRFSEALTGLKDVHVRRGIDGDFHLEESGFSVEMTPELRIFLKNFLDTLLMIYRQLRDKSLKEVFKLLSGASEPDRHIQTPLKKPDSAEVMAFIFSEESSPSWPLDPGTLENMTQANYQHAQKAVDFAEALHKNYFECLEKHLLRSLNSLKQAKANYCQIADERFAEHKSTLTSWGEIFDVLIKLLSDYMEEHLHIRVIPCERGDQYDPDRNTPTGPVETDDELGPNRVKSVDEDGYQYVHEDRTLVVKPARVTVTG